MTIKAWRRLVFVPWLSLPLVALSYMVTWDGLPERLVTQFDFAGRPNGWMGRGYFVALSIGVLLLALINFTRKALPQVRPDSGGRAVLVTYYLVVGLMTAVFLGLLWYNS